MIRESVLAVDVYYSTIFAGSDLDVKFKSLSCNLK